MRRSRPPTLQRDHGETMLLEPSTYATTLCEVINTSSSPADQSVNRLWIYKHAGALFATTKTLNTMRLQTSLSAFTPRCEPAFQHSIISLRNSITWDLPSLHTHLHATYPQVVVLNDTDGEQSQSSYCNAEHPRCEVAIQGGDGLVYAYTASWISSSANAPTNNMHKNKPPKPDSHKTRRSILVEMGNIPISTMACVRKEVDLLLLHKSPCGERGVGSRTRRSLAKMEWMGEYAPYIANY